MKSKRIFLSYGRADADNLAMQLAQDLKARGHDVWLDQEQLRAGKAWEARIEAAIESREAFTAALGGVHLFEVFTEPSGLIHGLPVRATE